jgi:hypothetical protein
MRRIEPRRGRAFAAWAAAVALAAVVTGAAPLKKKRAEAPPKVEETVSNLAYIVSGQDIKLEGVGLVAGLDNTGVDPPPSYYRQKLLDEMLKAGVENPKRILADPRMAMVIVRVKIPTGTTTSDRLDAEIELPAASGTTSLAGGYLIQTRLREVLVSGGVHEGKEFALARGPVMIGTEAKPNDPKVGRVLGGVRVLKDVPFNLVIRQSRKSARNAYLLEKVVNQRFHESAGPKQEGAAKTLMSDQFLVLTVPRVYHHNPGRFFEVVRRLPLVDDPALRAARQEIWGKQLLDVPTAGVASLSLEGLGPTAIEALKGGLASRHPQVRFFAAEALAYLNDPAGVAVLGETVVGRPEFRAYALSALAALDQAASRTKLKSLMDVPDVQVRYGAFNALRTLDDHDPLLGRVPVIEEPKVDPDDEDADSMAVALSRARLRGRQEDPFALYVVDSEGPPMVHVARTRRCEIVIFGRDVKLLTPVVLGTGPILLNAADGDEKLEISKIVATKFGSSDEKVVTSLELADVLRRAADLGSSYPQIVSVLVDAFKQKNLPGPLVVDAVPAGSAVYVQAAIMGKDATKKDDAVTRTSHEEPKRRSLFDRLRGRK